MPMRLLCHFFFFFQLYLVKVTVFILVESKTPIELQNLRSESTKPQSVWIHSWERILLILLCVLGYAQDNSKLRSKLQSICVVVSRNHEVMWNHKIYLGFTRHPVQMYWRKNKSQALNVHLLSTCSFGCCIEFASVEKCLPLYKDAMVKLHCRAIRSCRRMRNTVCFNMVYWE